MISRAKQFVIISLATLCAPAFGANPAHPGTINYIEGSAFVAGQPVTQQSVGTVSLEPGQVRWLDAQTHADENTGTRPTHVIFVELKDH